MNSPWDLLSQPSGKFSHLSNNNKYPTKATIKIQGDVCVCIVNLTTIYSVFFLLCTAQFIILWRSYKYEAMIYTAWVGSCLKYCTSSLKILLISLPTGSMSWTWPAENPTMRYTPLGLAVSWLKSWQVGNVLPLYVRLSEGLVKSAAWRKRKK